MADHQTTAPKHPLVIDRATRKMRLATQEDIRRMEQICAAYENIIENARLVVERSDELKEQLNNACR